MVAMKFKVVKNNNVFYLKYKGWLFWRYVKEEWGKGWDVAPIEFNSVEEAESYAKNNGNNPNLNKILTVKIFKV
jgi:hypothetical protein